MSRPTMVCWLALLAVCTLAPAAGCGRSYYRRQADDEVYTVITEKANHPHWDLPRITIDLDPASRMFDPYNPDRPPMPIDDPVSHTYMHWVDGKRGYPHWHANGHTTFSENPTWLAYLPVNEQGVLTLDGAGAVRLALLHSPVYQQQMETLYLAAMDVSSERFRFDIQYFGGYGVDFLSSGPLVSPGGVPRSQLSLSTRGWQARRFFTTGAEAVIGFANTLMWQFSGPNTYSANSLIDFSFVQPLLRQAGRARIMETLTLSERTMLANVRQMERYRQGFYMSIMTGTGNQPGPTRRGGFFGAAGLGGFAGVGGGGFGGVGGQTFGVFGGGGPGFVVGAGAAAAGGFLGLLQDQQVIRNQEANIAALQSSLAQLEAFREAGRIDFFQVEQVRQQVFQNLSQLLTSKRIYQDSLDSFKQDLGLPPYVPLAVEDPILEPFRMIDIEIVPVQNRVTQLQREVGNLIIEMLPGEQPTEWSPELRSRLRRLADYVEEMTAARRTILDRNIPRARDDIEGLEQAVPRRIEAARRLRRMAERARARIALPGEERLIADVDESLFDTSDLEGLPESLIFSMDRVIQQLETAIVESERLMSDLRELQERGEQLEPAELRRELQEHVFDLLPAQLTDLANNILELSLIQARARAESVVLTPVDIDPVDALEIARIFRHDWMNARASLVDSWRLIEFNANNLEAQLDIVFGGDIGTTGNNPFAFNDATGNLRAGIRFDAPITRLQERNVYRQALIEYQQSRRNYYRFEDAIANQLRSILRQLELNKVNFELRRVALRVAVDQVQSARIQLEEPPRPAVIGDTSPPGALPLTTAQNLLTALAALRGAQDDFLSVWVNFEVQRGLLDLNMGTMELDAEGLWLDPGAIGPDFNYPNLDDLNGLCPWVWTKEGLGPRPRDDYEDLPPGDHDYVPAEIYLNGEQSLPPPPSGDGSSHRTARLPGPTSSENPGRFRPDEAENGSEGAVAPGNSRRNRLPRLEAFQRAAHNAASDNSPTQGAPAEVPGHSQPWSEPPREMPDSENRSEPLREMPSQRRGIPSQPPKGTASPLRSVSWWFDGAESPAGAVPLDRTWITPPGLGRGESGVAQAAYAGEDAGSAIFSSEPEWAADWEVLGTLPVDPAPRARGPVER